MWAGVGPSSKVRYTTPAEPAPGPAAGGGGAAGAWGAAAGVAAGGAGAGWLPGPSSFGQVSGPTLPVPRMPWAAWNRRTWRAVNVP